MKTSCTRHPVQAGVWLEEAGGSRSPGSPFLVGGATSSCPGSEGRDEGALYPIWFGSWNLAYCADHRRNTTIIRGTFGESNFPPNLPIKEMNRPSLAFYDSQANPPKGCHPCPRPSGPREPGETCPCGPDAGSGAGAVLRPGREPGLHPGCLSPRRAVITGGVGRYQRSRGLIPPWTRTSQVRAQVHAGSVRDPT